MRKFLFPVAAVLAWSFALAAISRFDDRDAAQVEITERPASAGEPSSAKKVKVRSPAELEAGHVALQKQ